jgi:hypothetical protein
MCRLLPNFYYNYLHSLTCLEKFEKSYKILAIPFHGKFPLQYLCTILSNLYSVALILKIKAWDFMNLHMCSGNR